MQRYVCLMDDKAMGDTRAMASPKDALSMRPGDPRPVAVVFNRPAAFIRKEEDVPPGFVPAHEFVAADAADANRYFRRMQDEGMPMDPAAVGDASRNAGDATRMWRFRGDRHYIKSRLPDFGLGDHNEKLLQANPQWRQITSMLGQLCDQYHRARKQDGVAQLSDWQRGPIARSLESAEQDVAKLGVLLAAAIDAMNAGYRAFGIEHRRRFTLSIAAPEPAPTPDEPPPADQPTPAEPNPNKRPKPAIAR